MMLGQLRLAAPDARFGHTAVWTGSEMIIWGGYDGSNDFNTGYKYNPAYRYVDRYQHHQCT